MVAHGLNVQPIAMLPFIKWLNSHGSDVYLVQLSGHHKNSVHIKAVTASVWQKEMLAVYSIASKASLEHAAPLYFLGYSLGALLGQSMIAFSKEITHFDKQVLIAPATAIRQRSYLVKLLFLLSKKRMLPSYTPKRYRFNEALPLSIYGILFAEEKKLWKVRFDGLNIPTVIIIDPKDELISYKKLIRSIKSFRLTNYSVIVLNDDLKGRNGKYHHLVIDEQTMGTANWKMATQQIAAFLFESSEISNINLKH